LLSGLITVPTSTRGICVRAYTLRGEEEREKETEREKGEKEREKEKKREREREVGGGVGNEGRKRRCNIARLGPSLCVSAYMYTRERFAV